MLHISYKPLLLAVTFLFLVACSEEPDTTSVNHSASVNNSESTGKQEIDKPSSLSSIPAIATIETSQLHSLNQGETFLFKEQNQEPISIPIDTRRTDANGTVSLSGTHRDDKGAYQLTATVGESIAFGRIQTPETTYTFTIKAGKTTLVDLHGPGNTLVPKNPDDAILPQRNTEKNTSNTESSVSSIPSTVNSVPSVSGKTTIDLMVVYSDGFASEYPGDTVTTRLSYLVNFANTLYDNSNVNIYLRLVHTLQVSYPDNTTNSSTLTDLVSGAGVLSSIETLRQQHGADLVSFIRPYDKSNHSGCGIAYLLGNNSNGFTYDAPYGYSVVGDGSETVGSITYYCSEQSLAHELGHNMGSSHDRDHASSAGVYDYSYGYGIDDKFGTVMSYINPEIDYFSNPDITCYEGSTTISCGISEESTDSADNALSLNNAATSVATFVVAKYSADVDGDGDTDTTDALKALMLLSGKSITGTVSAMQDINDDGTLGLAEAIYSLQKSKN